MASRAGEGRGVALILTLAILVVISILCVTFVSSSSQDRGATKSYAQSLLAEQIGLGGLDQVVSQLQAQATDPLLSGSLPAGGSATLYIPQAASNAVPQRMTSNAPSLAALIGYSGTNLYTRGAGATNFGSASSTLTPSLNGRAVTLTQWALPRLVTSTNGFPAPRWILMTRSGPQAAGAYAAALADASPFNNGYVVGRYAYTVYDTSGLLDINVAGYPGTASAGAARKGLLPWADLTQLPGLAQADVDKLVAWRNAGTEGSYAANVYAAATNNGFTRVANQDTAFLGRQDLLKYAQTQLPALTNALPYLTTFSRELNGPTWGPSTNTASFPYVANQYQAASYNPRVPFPPATAVFSRANGVSSVVGEPLVKYRFPLSKLALLEQVGTVYTTADYNADKDSIKTNIQKYFGLDLAPDANGPGYRHWIYPTTNAAYPHAGGGIMTLGDVSLLGKREPDFFELLQAGMLEGSLGLTGRADAYNNYKSPPLLPAFLDPDSKDTLQVLRTGAALIDQWDADNYPTTLTLTPPTGAAPITVYGVEDLPQIFAAFVNPYTPGTGLPPTVYVYFELWNPHQVPTGTPAAYPTQFQISPLYNPAAPADSDTYTLGFYASVGSPAKPYVWLRYGNAFPLLMTASMRNQFGELAQPNLPFSVTAPATAYREPALVAGTTAGAPPPLDGIACYALPLPFPATTDKSNDYGTTTHVNAPDFTTTAYQIKAYLSMVMRLQYKDPSNQWHTYGTFVGIDDAPANAAFPVGTGYYNSPVYPVSTTGSYGAPALVKSDPRTSRLGPGFSLSSTPYANANVNLSASSGAMTFPVTGAAPFNAPATPVPYAPYRLDMWAANDASVAAPAPNCGTPYYADPDGVMRWGDARNPYKKPAPGSPLFNGANANRPVVLNRPFQSVGELGYAFRDAPWKTLDFFSPNSADAGLLDLFTLSDAPVVAGRVNPNAAPPQVLAAMISGAAISPSDALALGQALSSTATNTPFLNRAEIASRFLTNAAVAAAIPSGIKTEQEAVVRALAESANTRTWNFLVDIIAQTGRYPATATTLDNFAVDGARRYWLHVAIDRYTGQVVDKQVEVVNQ